MIRTGTPDEAAANRRKLTPANGTGYFKSEFIASPFDAPLAPQSFLVEQDPDSVILPPDGALAAPAHAGGLARFYMTPQAGRASPARCCPAGRRCS